MVNDPLSMAANLALGNASPPLKYESPYATEASSYPLQQNLKRRHSDSANDIQESEEKRQRIQLGQIPTIPQGEPAPTVLPSVEAPEEEEDDFLAQMVAAAQASVEERMGGGFASFPSQPAHDGGYVLQNGSTYMEHGYGNYPAQNTGGEGFSNDPHLYTRILSLPILESLSTQILATLAQGPYEETIAVVTQPESESGQAYATLKSLFEQTKKIYSQTNAFLSPEELHITEQGHRATTRIANLATFVSSVFGGSDIGFYELNDHFLETFMPENESLIKEAGELYLNLKTQMYLSAVSQDEQERTKEEILEDLFPSNFNEILLTRHPGLPLSEYEIEFASQSDARREYLDKATGAVESIAALSEEYAWEDFLKGLSTHINNSYSTLIAPYAPKATDKELMKFHDENGGQGTTQQPENDGDLDMDALERATQAATQAVLQFGYGQYNEQQSNQGPPQSQHHLQPQNGQPQSYQQYQISTPSTQAMYQRARSTATKPAPGTRLPGPSARRPWTTEEENCLMGALDEVKGAHWSQILSLHGLNGTRSEILKNRSQIQLKDKARNLKLFFLKQGSVLPPILHHVTGTLLTRAPSQAAKKEKEAEGRGFGEGSSSPGAGGPFGEVQGSPLLSGHDGATTGHDGVMTNHDGMPTSSAIDGNLHSKQGTSLIGGEERLEIIANDQNPPVPAKPVEEQRIEDVLLKRLKESGAKDANLQLSSRPTNRPSAGLASS